MSGRKWTPGPWRVGHLESYEMDGTPFRRVYFPDQNGDNADLHEGHIRGADCDANAHLIAAAPDLYDALDRAAKWIANGHDGIAPMMRQIYAAMAKARGDL